MTIFCSKCGQEVETGGRYCTECGSPLGGAAVQNKGFSSRSLKILGLGVTMILVVVALLVFLPGDNPHASPEEVVDAFFKEMQKHNIKGATVLIAPEEVEKRGMLDDKVIESYSENLNGFPLIDYQIGSINKKSDYHASVEVTLVIGQSDDFSTDKFNYNVIKQGQKWYVDKGFFLGDYFLMIPLHQFLVEKYYLDKGFFPGEDPHSSPEEVVYAFFKEMRRHNIKGAIALIAPEEVKKRGLLDDKVIESYSDGLKEYPYIDYQVNAVNKKNDYRASVEVTVLLGYEGQILSDIHHYIVIKDDEKWYIDPFDLSS